MQNTDMDKLFAAFEAFAAQSSRELWAVADEVKNLGLKVDTLADDVEKLKDLLNKGKGAVQALIWLGGSVIGLVGALAAVNNMLRH